MVKQIPLPEVVEKMRSYRTLEREGNVLDGRPVFREDREVRLALDELRLPREVITLAMLDGGLVAPALERDGIVLIGGGGPGGSALYVQSQNEDQSRRFTLPHARFARITDVLPELSEAIPPMTPEEARIRSDTLQAIAALGELVPTLTARGKDPFSLGDGWRVEGDGVVRFLLNPRDQKHDQRGWYTLAELRQWAEDKGPVKNVRQDKSPV